MNRRVRATIRRRKEQKKQLDARLTRINISMPAEVVLDFSQLHCFPYNGLFGLEI